MTMPVIRLRFSPTEPKLRARVYPGIPPLQAAFRNNGTSIQWRVGASGAWTDIATLESITGPVAGIVGGIGIAVNSGDITHPIVSLGDRPDARNYLDVSSYVATRALLKAIDTTKETVAYLTEAGRQGWFVLMTGDYSAKVAIDTLEGVYIKADAIASSAGAWMRVYATALDVGWFGADPTHTVDSSPAVQGAVNLLQYNDNNRGGRIGAGAGNYKMNTSIVFTPYSQLHNITFFGAGMQATVFDFSGATGKGFYTNGAGAYLHLSDFTVYAAPAEGVHVDGVSYSSVSRVKAQSGGSTGVRASNVVDFVLSENVLRNNTVNGALFDGFNTTVTIRDNQAFSNANAAFSLNGVVGFAILRNGHDANRFGIVGSNLRGGIISGNYFEANTRDPILLQTSDALASGIPSAAQDIHGLEISGNYCFDNASETPATYGSFIRLITANSRSLEVSIKNNEAIRHNVADFSVVADGSAGTITVWEEGNHFDGSWTTAGTVNRRTTVNINEAQTFTNKTIDASANTISNLATSMFTTTDPARLTAETMHMLHGGI